MAPLALRKARFWVTLRFNEVEWRKFREGSGGVAHYTLITYGNDNTVILSGVPTKEYFEELISEEYRIGGVITLTEPFETAGPKFISKEQWISKGIEVFDEITWVDYNNSPKAEELLKCVKFIFKIKSAGKRVLVHCKGGRSRSDTVVVAYLLYMQYRLNQPINVDEATEVIRRQRPQIKVSPNKLVGLRAFSDHLMQRRAASATN